MLEVAGKGVYKLIKFSLHHAAVITCSFRLEQGGADTDLTAPHCYRRKLGRTLAIWGVGAPEFKTMCVTIRLPSLADEKA